MKLNFFVLLLNGEIKTATYLLGKLFVDFQELSQPLLIPVLVLYHDYSVLLTQDAFKDFNSVLLEVLADPLVLRDSDQLVSHSALHLLHQHWHFAVRLLRKDSHPFCLLNFLEDMCQRLDAVHLGCLSSHTVQIVLLVRRVFVVPAAFIVVGLLT